MHVLGMKVREIKREMPNKNPSTKIKHIKSFVEVEDLSSTAPSNDQPDIGIPMTQMKS